MRLPSQVEPGGPHGTPTSRARWARQLMREPLSISAAELSLALQRETVPHIRRMLVEVLKARGETAGADATIATAGERSIAAEAPRRGLGMFGSTIRHELNPPLGRLQVAAHDEIDDFDSSRTKVELERLKRRVRSLEALASIAEEAPYEEIDVISVVEEEWPGELGKLTLLSGETDGTLKLRSSRALLSMLVANVLQNAHDAMEESGSRAPCDVTWGESRNRFWLRVSNPFGGERLALDEVLSRGASSKYQHAGEGLYLVDSIAEKLGFEIDLAGTAGVAQFTIRGDKNRG